MTFPATGEDAAPLDPSKAVTIGRISSAHGIRGEVKVQPLTDFPRRFDRNNRVWLKGRPYSIEASRLVQGSYLLKLTGIEDRTAAEAVRGEELQVPEAQPIYEKDRFYLHDIIGLDVTEADGSKLGRLHDVMSTGANDVFVVRGERGELLLPVIEDVVADIDVAGKRIVVNLLPGLEFTPPKRSRSGPGSKAQDV